MKPFVGEKKSKVNSTKIVYKFVDTSKKIDQTSREVFKQKDVEIHYPIGYEGGQKYSNIRKITFIGFKSKLPIGVLKSATKGYGFTRPLKQFAYHLNNDYKIKEVVVQKGGKVELNTKKKVVYINEDSLRTLNGSFQAILKKNKGEVELILQNSMHSLFPKAVKKPTKKKYVADDLANQLNRWGNSIDEFSKGDKDAIKDLFDKLSMDTDFLTSQALSKTREIVDNKYIKATLNRYKELMKKATNEKKWQAFIKSNNWIFSSIFAQPVILFRDEAYVGGKTIDNSNGKFNDFMIKNDLTDNVSFLEIKTHKTDLLENSPYRGTDVFSASKELTGCMIQVLNQRDNFQKEYYQFKGKAKQGEKFETLNSKCLVLVGEAKGLSAKQKVSFELFRNNSRDVEVLTFDELEHKIKSLQEILLKK